MHPRLALSGGGAVAADGENNDEEEKSHVVCYAIVVSCMSLVLFYVLLAVVTVPMACAVTGVIVLLFGISVWFAPTARGAGGIAARQATPRLVLRRRCACAGLAEGAIGELRIFVYERPERIIGGGADDGGGKAPRGSCLLCAVCLEGVQAGETVRQLPACRHMFHVDCIDAWLRTSQTCPLCRCDILPRKATVKANAAAAAAGQSSANRLPPV